MSSKLLDIYLGSKELKKLLISRSEELQIPFKYICHDLGIDYTDFMKQYINSNSANMPIGEEMFGKILSYLGINVRFQFVVDTGFRALEVQQELKNKYETSRRKRNLITGSSVDGDKEEAGDYPVFD